MTPTWSHQRRMTVAHQILREGAKAFFPQVLAEVPPPPSAALASVHRLQTQKRRAASRAEHFGLPDLNNGRSPSSFVLQPNDAGGEPDPSQEKSQKEEPPQPRANKGSDRSGQGGLCL